MTSSNPEKLQERLQKFMGGYFALDKKRRREEIKARLASIGSADKDDSAVVSAKSSSGTQNAPAATTHKGDSGIPSGNVLPNLSALVSSAQFKSIVEGQFSVLMGNVRKADKSSAVFEARHARTGSRLLMKVFPVSPDAGAVESTLSAIASIDHPCSVRLRDVGSIRYKGVLMCITARDFVEGVALSELLDSPGAIAPARAAALSKQLLVAVADAHAKGVYHGRVDTAHTIISKDAVGAEHLCIVDFEGSLHRDYPSIPAARSDGKMSLPMPGRDAAGVGDVICRMFTGKTADSVDWSSFEKCSDDLQGRGGEELYGFLETLFGDNSKAMDTDLETMLEDFQKLEFNDSAEPVEDSLLPVESFSYERIVTHYTNSGTLNTLFLARCQTLQSKETPSIWVMNNDPAMSRPEVEQAISQLETQYNVVRLDDNQRQIVGRQIEDGTVVSPWLLLLGDLDILLKDELLDQLGTCSEMSRVLFSTHPNADMLSNSINELGLDQFICLPSESEQIVVALETMLEKTRQMLSHHDSIRLRLRKAKETVSQMNRNFAAQSRESQF